MKGLTFTEPELIVITGGSEVTTILGFLFGNHVICFERRVGSFQLVIKVTVHSRKEVKTKCEGSSDIHSGVQRE